MATSPALQRWHTADTSAGSDAWVVETLGPKELASSEFVARWDELARATAEPNPYFESWFLNPSLAQFGLGEAVDVLTVSRANRLIGLFPVARQWDYYGKPIPHLAGWHHANVFSGTPLVRKGEEDTFWAALLDWGDIHAGTALFLHLAELPLDIALYEALQRVVARQDREWGMVERYERAVMKAGLSSEDYRAAHHSKRKRKDMRRRLRKLREAGEVAFQWHDDDAGVDAWIDNFLFIEASGWKGEAGSALACSTDTAALFRQTVRSAAERGRATRLSLKLDGRPIAMLINFVCGHAAFGFKTAFDEEFSACSPGVLLEDEYLRELDRPGFGWSDSCAAADHPVMNSMWAERRPIGKISISIGGRARRLLGSSIIRLETARQEQGA